MKQTATDRGEVWWKRIFSCWDILRPIQWRWGLLSDKNIIYSRWLTIWMSSAKVYDKLCSFPSKLAPKSKGSPTGRNSVSARSKWPWPLPFGMPGCIPLTIKNCQLIFLQERCVPGWSRDSCLTLNVAKILQQQIDIKKNRHFLVFLNFSGLVIPL